MKKIEEEDLPPLSEIDDICEGGLVFVHSFYIFLIYLLLEISVQLYVQSVRLLRQSGISEDEDPQAAFDDPVTGNETILFVMIGVIMKHGIV